MTTAIRRRRGTTAQHSTFIGLDGETTIDTDKEVVVVHDGTTQGGFPLMRENGSNSALALGSAGTPSLKFTGDTNTGIYSPGADQVAISTNGTGRLFVDASGNVGVGAAPVVPLDIQQAQATQRLYSTTGTNTSHIQFRNTGGIAYVGLDSSTGGSFGAAYGLSLAHTGAYPITFVTNGNERMRLDSSGRLGLGTSSPQTILDLASTAPTIQFTDTTSAGERNWRVGISDVTEGDFNITQETGDDTNTYASRLYINSSGNVGIGTTSPTFAASYTGLHLDGGANGPAVRLTNSTTGSTATDGFDIILQQGGSDGYIWQRESASIILGTAATERARIDSSGRLLVGTSTTSAIATAVFQKRNDGANSSLVRFESAQTSPATNEQLSVLVFGTAGNTLGNGSAYILCERDGGTWTNNSSMPGRLVFSTTADGASSPTERMRISNDGLTATFATTSAFIAASAEAAGTTHYTFVGRRSATSTQTGVTTFGVFTNGNAVNTNNSYGAISDIKLKENIVDANSQWDDLKALQVRKYNFKEGQTHTQIGLVAQEAELISPGLVTESPDRDEDGNDLGTTTKSVNYSVLYMKAVKALQEAMERIEALEAKVAALEAS
jgi:hypothetical protein